MTNEQDFAGAPSAWEQKLEATKIASYRKPEVAFSEEDYRTFMLLITCNTKVRYWDSPGLNPQWQAAVREAAEESLRENGIAKGPNMVTSVDEFLLSLEEARDSCIRDTLKQPPELGIVRGAIRRALLLLYRLTAIGAEFPDRY